MQHLIHVSEQQLNNVALSCDLNEWKLSNCVEHSCDSLLALSLPLFTLASSSLRDGRTSNSPARSPSLGWLLYHLLSFCPPSGQLPGSEECCRKKTVGGVRWVAEVQEKGHSCLFPSYLLVGPDSEWKLTGDNWQELSCLSPCVYERVRNLSFALLLLPPLLPKLNSILILALDTIARSLFCSCSCSYSCSFFCSSFSFRRRECLICLICSALRMEISALSAMMKW